MADELIVSREQLYQEVWSTPMIKLAWKYGLSDVGMAKVCKRHNIPRPGLGYWRKKETGHKVTQKKLPPLKEGQDKVIRFKKPQHTRPEEELLSCGTDVNVIALEIIQTKPRVANELSAPHPLIEQTRECLLKAPVDDVGMYLLAGLECVPLEVSPGTLDRSLRTMDAILKALAIQDIFAEIQSTENTPICLIHIGDDPVRIGMEEIVSHRKISPAIPEGEKVVNQYSSYYSRPQYEDLPSGRLSLKIHEHIDGIRKTWSDAKYQRVEKCVCDYIATIFATHDSIKARRLEEERQEELRRKQEELDEKIQTLHGRLKARRKKERKRVKRLRSELSRWHLSRCLRDYIGAIVSKSREEDEGILNENRVNEWVQWASRQADLIDPLIPTTPGLLEIKEIDDIWFPPNTVEKEVTRYEYVDRPREKHWTEGYFWQARRKGLI